MRSWTVLAVVITCVFWMTVSVSYGFNLDTKIPIVKKGPEASHFGFTVAQHKSSIPGAPSTVSKRFKSWMLVGAPKGENLQPNTTRSGALFKCPLTTYEDDCKQVMTDGIKTEEGDILGPEDDEIKDDQWMGVTVKSQGEGGDILVCAHRYRNKGRGAQNFQWGYGLCYRLDDEFQFEKVYQPCFGRPVERAQEQFGYCQTGTSGVILEDEVVLGLPGTYNWRGTIHTKNTSRDELHRDITPYFGVYTEAESPVKKYSYLGYSVTAGRFFGDKMSYVAGAPRSEDVGQVIFFSREKLYIPNMNYDLILTGEMFASSFGFEVLAMDINKDGHDDLVVSAPFYFTDKNSGAVYIYMNKGRGFTSESRFTRLLGPPGESRFGFSMTSLGDLDADGFNDLAVGAPYDKDGAIYIFLGTKDGIKVEPSQVIRAEDLPGEPLNAFGYALSGGLDLDGNNYTDLLTSSFCSDKVILLRARPIVSIETDVDTSKMNNIDTTIFGCPNDRNSPLTCINFKTCFTMTNEAGTLTRLSVRYNISEILYKDQPVHRILFHTDGSDASTLERSINLRPKNMKQLQCFDEVVYLRSDIRDKLRPIKFKLSYEIVQEEPKPVAPGRPLPDIDDYPILNQNEAIKYFEATFAKDCGDDDRCISDLIVEAEMDLDRHPTEDYFMYELGKQQFFNLTVKVTNKGEPAYIPNLYIEHDKAVDLSPRESQTGSYQCASAENGLVKCNLDNPFLNTTGNLYFVFKPSGLNFTSRFVDLRIWANSTSEELDASNNEVQFSLEVKRRAEISITGAAEPEQVFYSGDIIGESAMEELSDVGTEIVHKYLINNRGPWKVDVLTVTIHWPYQAENNEEKGKWLLYLTDIPTVDGNGECDVSARYVNELNLRHKKVVIDGEIDTGRLRGGGYPIKPKVDTTDKIRKVTTIKKTTTTKKSYEKKTTSKSSSSSSSTEKKEESHTGRDHSQSNSRMSRKVTSSSGKNGITPDQHEDNDHEENTKSIYISESRKLEKVETVNAVSVGDQSYLIGMDTRGRIIWTSNGLLEADGIDEEYRRKMEENYRLLHSYIADIKDFRVITVNDISWVNGYDAHNSIVWSSKWSDSEEGSSFSSKKYSYIETTRNGKGEKKWTTSVTDKDGTRTSSGSSTIGEEDPWHNWKSEHSKNFDSSIVVPNNWDRPESRTYESRRTEIISSSSSSSSSSDGNGNNSEGGRWYASGGFKTPHGEHPMNDDPDSRGKTFSRTVIDPETGRANVLSHKVYSDDYDEVLHGPYDDQEWMSSDHKDEGRPLKRNKRDREFVIKPQAITDVHTGKTQHVIYFTCDGDVPTAKCFTFNCTIRNLGPEQSATIKIPARLWNSTLVEDYPRVSRVSIKSKGQVYLPEEIRDDQDPSDDVDYAETVALSNLLELLTSTAVPTWVIIVSVLAGLLLLAILAFILYKLGFFDRKRPDPTLSGNLDRDINGYN